MKAKKYLCRLTSALIAVVMLIGIFPIISFADDGVLLNYTFDSEEAVTVNFQDNISGTLYKYDGFNHTFLNGEEGGSVWGCGWYNYDTDRKGVSNGIPTENELFMSDGKLHARMNNDNSIWIYIPVTSANEGNYDISFDYFDLNGSMSAIVDKGRDDLNTPLSCNATSYSGTVSLQAGNFLRIVAGNDGTTFAIDNLKVQKHVDKAFEASVTSAIPANGLENVTTYIKPQITFDRAISAADKDKIKLLNGSDEIETTNSLSTDSKTVYLAVANNKLPANATLTISVPGNNDDITFKTGDANLIFATDFEKSDNNYGMLYGLPTGATIEKCGALGGSNALKLTYKDAWAGENIVFVGGSDCCPALNADNVNLRYKISFDVHVETNKEILLWFNSNGDGDRTLLRTNANTTTHVEKTVCSTNLWSAYIKTQKRTDTVDSENTPVVYIDNIRVEDVKAEPYAEVKYGSMVLKNGDMKTGLAGNNLTATFVNNFGESLNGTYKAYIAIYYGNTLVNAAASDVTLTNGVVTGSVSAAVPTIENTNTRDYSVKVFLWDDNMVPTVVPTEISQYYEG